MYFSILISSVVLLSWKFVSFKRLHYYRIIFNSFMCTLPKWLSYVKYHVCHITVLSNIQVWHSCGKTTSYLMFSVSWIIRSSSRSRHVVGFVGISKSLQQLESMVDMYKRLFACLYAILSAYNLSSRAIFVSVVWIPTHDSLFGLCVIWIYSAEIGEMILKGFLYL